MPKNWFIVRTGHTYGNAELSERGKKQIERINDVLKNGLNISSNNLAIFYTPSKRGYETAKILGKKSEKTRIKELWTDFDKPKEFIASVSLAYSKILEIRLNMDSFVVITDNIGTSEFSKYLSRIYLKTPLEFSPLLHGETYWLNIKSEEWRRIPSNERLYHSERIMVKG
jgi:hypothetical protein